LIPSSEALARTTVMAGETVDIEGERGTLAPENMRQERANANKEKGSSQYCVDNLRLTTKWIGCQVLALQF
jgi:hypothetical protein